MSKKEILGLPAASGDPIQPESRSVMKWVLENPFLLSISFHGGCVGAFWPYDDGPCYRYCLSATPDNQLMKYLASIYSSNHDDMHRGILCKGRKFENGIANGADWYRLAGSMTDFNYLFSNCFEITVELTCCKYPKAHTLELEWKKNVKSLVKYLQAAHIGIKGFVFDHNGNSISDAKIEVVGNEKKITTSPRGEFWRLLLPGQYKIRAIGLCTPNQCKISDTIDITIKNGEVSRHNFILNSRTGNYFSINIK